MTREQLAELMREADERFRALPIEEQRRQRLMQRRSYVRGEMMMEYPEMTREQVDALIDRSIPELKGIP